MGRPSGGYRNCKGDKIPGTTTILGRYKESGALIQWAYKQGREHQDLESRGLPGPKNLYEVKDSAALSGTLAHDMIECSILGTLYMPPVDVDSAVLRRAANAFAQYEEWRSQSKMEIIATEKAYVSERYQFGGTVDAIGRDSKGRIVLVDWKSSNAVYTEYLYQLAAYSLLVDECTSWDVQGFHMLRVAKESGDFAHYFFDELNVAREAFPMMVKLYALDAQLKKRLK